MSARHPTKVFISYSRKDGAVVSRLVDALETIAEIEVFRDTQDVLPTEEWRERLAQLIAEADAVVFALSPHSAASRICGWEVEQACRLNKRIAPVVIEAVDPALIPGGLARLNYIFLTEPREYDASLRNLVTALTAEIGWIREHTRLGLLAERWSDGGRPRTQVLRGEDLTGAETWLTAQPADAPAPTAHHREFIQASRRAATRRLHGSLGGAAAAAVVASALAGYALVQQHAAEQNALIAAQERDRAVAAEQLAESHARAEQAAREEAEAALHAATEAADRLIFDIVHEYRDTGLPVATITRILEITQTLQDTLIDQAPDDTELLRSKISALSQLARTLHSQGDTPAALAAAEQSLAIARMLVEREPENTEWQRYLAMTLQDIGSVQEDMGDSREALHAYDECVLIVRNLTGRYPEERQQSDLAYCLIAVGDVQLSRNEHQSAFDAFDEALEIRRHLHDRAPDDPTLLDDLSTSLDRIGIAHMSMGDMDRAIKAFEESVEVTRQLALTSTGNTSWQEALSASILKLVYAQRMVGDHDSALELAAEALAIRRTLAGTDPGNASWQQDLVIALNVVGGLQFDKSDSEPSLTSLEEALAVARALVDQDGSNTYWQTMLAGTLWSIARVRNVLGQTESAAHAFEEVLAIRRGLVEHDPENTSWRMNLVRSLYAVTLFSQDPVRNRAILSEAIAIVEALEAEGRLGDDGASLVESIRASLEALDREQDPVQM